MEKVDNARKMIARASEQVELADALVDKEYDQKCAAHEEACERFDRLQREYFRDVADCAELERKNANLRERLRDLGRRRLMESLFGREEDAVP